METTLVFSDELMTALTVLFIACTVAPAFYYVWYVYKKKLNHAGMLAGLAAFFLCGYLLPSMLLGSFAPADKSAEMAPAAYALLRALLVALPEVGGITVFLLFMSRRYSTVRVPIGFGLGFRLFDLLYLGALNALFRLANALTVNRDGLESLLESVDAASAPALVEQLELLAASAPKVYLMSAVDYVCMLVISVVVARFIWYGLEGGKLEEDRRLILLAFVLRFVAEFLQAFYSVGGASYGLCAGIYYVLTALAVCYCYYEARRRDDPEKIHADHIQWKQHRRLR